MPFVIGVRFHGVGKAYDFDPGRHAIKRGEALIVETSKGIEFGIAANVPYEKADGQLFGELRPVLRKATEADWETYRENCEREKEAYVICRERIEVHGLDMNLVDVEYTFDRQKIVFYFISENRVDFRELVKDLASTFHRRIELRQIGVRDEARMTGGLGICGRPFCCSTFLEDFVPVSVKMAKAQNLSMNPAKISGSCGRLMCCLKYEQAAYEQARKIAPKQGAFVRTPKGEGKVVAVDLLREWVGVLLAGQNGDEVQRFAFDEIRPSANAEAGAAANRPGCACPAKRGEPAARCPRQRSGEGAPEASSEAAPRAGSAPARAGEGLGEGLRVDEEYTTKAEADAAGRLLFTDSEEGEKPRREGGRRRSGRGRGGRGRSAKAQRAQGQAGGESEGGRGNEGRARRPAGERGAGRAGEARGEQ